MALIDDGVTVMGDDVLDTVLAHEALDHRDIKLAVTGLLARSHLTNPIVDTYFSPNRSVRELRDLVRVGSGIDPLRDFNEVAREEIRLFKGRWS